MRSRLYVSLFSALIRKGFERFGKVDMDGNVREMLRRQHRCPKRIPMPLWEEKDCLFQPGRNCISMRTWDLAISLVVRAFWMIAAHAKWVGQGRLR